MTYRDLLNTVKNLDEEINLSNFINSDSDSDKNKAYMYISGHEDEKVYIDGDVCYEVSEKIPGEFDFYEAKKIVELVYGDSWRLPSKDELDLIYENLKCKSHIIEDDNVYWSSSSHNNFTAWNQSFSDGTQYDNSYKYIHYSVRAVRAFKIKKDLKES
ncbi:DUF1566 domain-containing protein [Methanobrevibacter sp.]|uniref:Lcl domain-containing protein n=1 Tax=Methanobrevibacter sp. TaxID=66852 RepID=UPI00388E5817